MARDLVAVGDTDLAVGDVSGYGPRGDIGPIGGGPFDPASTRSRLRRAMDLAFVAPASVPIVPGPDLLGLDLPVARPPG